MIKNDPVLVKHISQFCEARGGILKQEGEAWIEDRKIGLYGWDIILQEEALNEFWYGGLHTYLINIGYDLNPTQLGIGLRPPYRFVGVDKLLWKIKSQLSKLLRRLADWMDRRSVLLRK
jgi:hypothetical protein